MTSIRTIARSGQPGLILSLLVVSGCASSGPSARYEEPMLSIERHYGFSAPSHRSGTIAAIWPDGGIVRLAVNGEEFEAHGVSDVYQVGTLEPDSVREILAAIAQSDSTQNLPQDCSADVAVLRTRDGAERRVIECLPHQSGDLIPDVTSRILSARLSEADNPTVNSERRLAQVRRIP